MPDPAPAKAKRTRSALNKEHLKEITLSRAVATAAVDPAHTAALAGVDFDDDLSGRANTLSDQLEAALGTLAGTRAGKKQTTDEEAAARAIHTRLSPGTDNAPPLDILPGIKPLGAIKTLSDAIAAYDAKNTTQGSQQEAAAAALEAIETTATELAEARREIQLAADQAWPWRTPGVKTNRKAFELPEDRPLAE